MTTISGINTFQAYSSIKPNNTTQFTDSKFSDVINKANAKSDPISAEQMEQITQSETVTKQLDFTSMTIQEVRDWVSAQRRAGLMTIEESAPFIFMTFRAIIVGGQLIDVGATDPTRYNFIKHLENGIPFAAARNDEQSLQLINSGIETMLRNQGKTYSLDLFV